MPELDDGALSKLYEKMLLSRRFDERLLQLQRQGRTGTFAPVKGQEAAQIGAVACLDERDWVVPAFRETAAALWRGTPMHRIILYNAGFNEGAHVDDGSRDLPISIPVASQLPIAVGLGYAAGVLAEDEIVLTFFGDGATSEGDFHEALNFAGVFDLPVVFLCQNNQWAISVPRSRQTKAQTLAQKAIAYGLPGIVVDGNDVLAVHGAVSAAVDRARGGDGPTLIECETYRMEVHTTADDPTRYREDDEVERWEERDPLLRLETFLRDRDLLSDASLKQLEREIDGDIGKAWEDAEARMEELDDAALMFDDVLAEPSDAQQAQRAQLVRARRSSGNDDDTGEDDDG